MAAAMKVTNRDVRTAPYIRPAWLSMVEPSKERLPPFKRERPMGVRFGLGLVLGVAGVRPPTSSAVPER